MDPTELMLAFSVMVERLVRAGLANTRAADHRFLCDPSARICLCVDLGGQPFAVRLMAQRESASGVEVREVFRLTQEPVKPSDFN